MIIVSPVLCPPAADPAEKLGCLALLEAHTDTECLAGTGRRPLLPPFVSAEGKRLHVRPIERQDRERFRALFLRLTPESRYRRYLSPKPDLTERELAHLLDIDHYRHEALAAVDEDDGSFVAVARYVQMSDRPEVVEAAIEVADDLHRHGIGTQLARETLTHARATGFERVVAFTLRENAAARALLQHLHFHRRASRGHELEFVLELLPDRATQSCGQIQP